MKSIPVAQFAWLTIAAAASFGYGSVASAKKCFHVASYSEEMSWTRDIDKEFRAKLQGTCTFETFYMDTKKNPGDEFAKKQGQHARDLIEKSKPDILFLSDDNAVKFVLLPFYRDAQLPVIFVGVNWTIKPYELPFKNTTGVIEVAPMEPMIYEVKKALPEAKTVGFVSVSTETERKDAPFVIERFKAAGYEVKEYWAQNFADWKKQYRQAQDETDFIYLGSTDGARDWNVKDAVDFVQKNQKKLTGGTYPWLVPYADFVLGKIASEQADIGSEQAQQIFGGKAPNSVLVTANKLYESYINKDLMDRIGVKLSDGFVRKAIFK